MFDFRMEGVVLVEATEEEAVGIVGVVSSAEGRQTSSILETGWLQFRHRDSVMLW